MAIVYKVFFLEIKYSGVFTPCKNCNIETRSRDYATVDEAVFSPCRAKESQTELSREWVAHRLASAVARQQL
jgi:hypothetical protein